MDRSTASLAAVFCLIKIILERSLSAVKSSLSKDFTVKGFHKYWVSRLHLHPDITCKRDGSSLVIAAANVNLLCDLAGMPDVTLKIREAKWNKEFGAQKKNICLEFFCMRLRSALFSRVLVLGIINLGWGLNYESVSYITVL